MRYGICLVEAVLLCLSLPHTSVGQVPAFRAEKSLEEARRAYEPLVAKAKTRLLAAIPQAHAQRLEKATIDIIPDDTPMGFSTLSAENGLITLGLGGLRTEALLIEATLVQGLIDDRFLFDYLTYLRRQHLKGTLGLFPLDLIALPDSQLPDFFRRKYDTAEMRSSPARAIGIPAKDVLTLLRPMIKELTINAYMFTLAHETAHLVYNDSMEPLPGESLANYKKRMRRQEERADEYATAKCKQNAGSGAAMGLIFWGTFMVYAEVDGKIQANPHPPDNFRVVKLMNAFFADWEGTSLLPSMKTMSKQELRKGMNLMISTLSSKAEADALLRDRDERLKRDAFDQFPSLKK